jgi:hypothetical protein
VVTSNAPFKGIALIPSHSAGRGSFPYLHRGRCLGLISVAAPQLTTDSIKEFVLCPLSAVPDGLGLSRFDFGGLFGSIG